MKEMGTNKAEKGFSFIEWVVSEISEISGVTMFPFVELNFFFNW